MSAQPRDEEFWVLKIINLLKSNLNTKITAINAEKADTITLSTVDANAYYYYTFGTTMPNYSPFVVFAVDVETEATVGGQFSERIKLMVQMIVPNGMVANPLTLYSTLARYRRAIKDVMIAEGRGFHGLSITKLPDSPFMAGNMLYHTVGLGVEFSYGN